MIEDGGAEVQGDDETLIRRKFRIVLILLGIVSLAGGILFGLYEMMVLGTTYAHWSTPTAEFKAAGDAKMMLALLLVVFGIGCLASTRRKHWLIVSVLALALVANAGIAAWLEELSEQAVSAERGYVIALEPSVPPPTAPVNYGQ